MAQRIGIIAGILLWGAASAAHTPLEFHAAPAAAAWQFEGNRTACRLTHEIPNFGEASFVQEAGGTLSFDLSAWRIDLNDEMDVTADAPEWLSLYPRTEALGKVTPRPPHEVRIGTDLAEAMLTALYRGEHPRLASKDVSVSLSAVSFRPVYDAYARCAAQLLPASFSQLERSTIHFAAGNAVLDDRAKARLDLIADYVHADQSVAHIRVAGHSDSTGRERGNRLLSEQRAKVVADYLIAAGCDAESVETRFFGSRIPAAPNITEEGRVQNRRVMVELERLRPKLAAR